MKGLKKNRFFDIQELGKKGASQERSPFEGSHSAFLNKHLERIENLNNLVRLPENGEVFFLHTEKAFNAFTFIPWLSQHHFIEELYASTYSISRRVVEVLQELQHLGRIGSVTLLISDSMIKRNAVTIDVLDAVVKNNPYFRVKYFWNHSKICLLKAGDLYLTLEGSGNWSENALLEQYVLVNSKEVFDFRKTIFE